MKTMEQIRKQLHVAWTFGVLGRDFLGSQDLTTMRDDWQQWIIDELRGEGLNLVADGDGYLALASEPHTPTSGDVPPLGTPIARIAFPTAEELSALYLEQAKPDPVQRTHPWARLNGVIGHVSLTHFSIESELYRYGSLLAERCWGRIYPPYQLDYFDQLVPCRYPLTHLLDGYGGFHSYFRDGEWTVYPVWSIYDAASFFAPIEPQINALLAELGIRGTVLTMNYPGYGKDYQFTAPQIEPHGAIVDVAGRPIKNPAALLARASIELWQFRSAMFANATQVW